MRRGEETWFCENWQAAIFYAIFIEEKGKRSCKDRYDTAEIYIYIVRRWPDYLLPHVVTGERKGVG
jgi:hypothetical protein